MPLGEWRKGWAARPSGRMRVRVGGVLAFLAFFVGAAIGRADTIVLKNGRRISALSVTEEGGKVRYLTSAGELSLPKEIVDHVERSGSSFSGSSTGASSSGAANLAITPPSEEGHVGSPEIEGGAVHDGAIDRDFLAKIGNEARSGDPRANLRAAIAYHAAAQFEASHGDVEHALADERAALTYAPSDPTLLLNMAYIHLRRSEFKQALEYVDRAERVVPDSPDLAKLEGWAYYGMNKLEEAVAAWKRALSLRNDPEVVAALQKAQRDKQEEENYKENESSHFTLRYSGTAEPELAREVLRTLESHFSEIESELDFTPPDSIGVVLYTQQAFADITQAPGWVGALNDGRIRVPVQGLTNVTPELSRILKHELTHSFVQQKTHGLAPTWIQEGLAQWMEGKRSDMSAPALVQIYDEKHAVPLGALEGSWMGFSGDTATYAYAWALANIEYIVQTDGMGDIERILDKIAAGSATEAAIHDVLHSDYEDLAQSTAEYLRKNYVH